VGWRGPIFGLSQALAFGLAAVVEDWGPLVLEDRACRANASARTPGAAVPTRALPRTEDSEEFSFRLSKSLFSFD